MVPWRRIATISVVALFVIAGIGLALLRSVVTGIAKDNLSNVDFEREHSAHPTDFGLTYQDIVIDSDGLGLVGWWIPAAADAPPERAQTTVILVHGYSAEMGKVLKRWGPNLHAAGFSILTFDLRNHGFSDDGPHGYVSYGAAEQRDVLAAMAYVRDNAGDLGVAPDRIILYGASMGAVSVLAASVPTPPGLRAVVFDSGYAGLRFQARFDGKEQGYPRFMVDWVVARMDDLAPARPTSVSPERTVQDVTVPLLLAHCSNDTRVDAVSHPRLVAVAPPGTETWFEPCPVGLSDEHHVDGWMLPQYNATVVDFLRRAMAPPMTGPS